MISFTKTKYRECVDVKSSVLTLDKLLQSRKSTRRSFFFFSLFLFIFKITQVYLLIRLFGPFIINLSSKVFWGYIWDECMY